MSRDALTFGLAAVGYLLLAKDAALRLAGRRWPWLGLLTAFVVSAHVALVWAWRFDGDLARAWSKGPAAFLVFHAAFALIAASPFLRGVRRDRTTWIAFAIVSAGVLPAPFRYPELSVLAIPLLAAFAGVVAVGVATRFSNRANTDE